MRIRLAYKLFGAFFLILAIVVGAMFFSRYLFFRNFRAYIHQEEISQLEAMTPSLQEVYQTFGSWEGVRTDKERWQHQLRLRSHFGKAPPPPAGDQDDRRSEPRVLLVDDRLQPIIGTPGPDDEIRLVAIAVDGKTVGWLGLRKREPFKSGPPAALVKVQTQQLSILGAAVIALTAFVAFLFSRHLLKPIQRLARGTRELADRNFTIRIASSTRDELGQLANNFNTMAETLENYEMMRHQWLTDISHELRTPLAVLRGEIEALQDGVRKPSPSNLASLHAEIIRISKLVEDLHLLSLEDADRIPCRKRRISPGQVLEKALASYYTRFRQHGIEIELQMDHNKDVRIKGDANRLEQVFTNIFENACKYVPPGGNLSITGGCCDQRMVLLFADSGPGVPGDALPRLFDRLYRVDPSRNRDSGGSGLGLSICQHIVQNHGGRIWAEQSRLGGLAIGIALPLMETENR